VPKKRQENFKNNKQNNEFKRDDIIEADFTVID
jgi:hypothetical protein